MKKLFPIIILLLSVIACDDDNRFPVNDTVIDFINKEYRGAVIREAEYNDNGLLEVEIRHDSRIKDVYFDSDDNWVYTSWDVSVLALPAAVMNAVEQAYPGYRIDDADYVERPEIVFYELELEKGGVAQLVYLAPDGTVITQ